MAIDNIVYDLPARRRDAGTVAINTAVALSEIAFALEEIRDGKDYTSRIDKLREISKILENHFDKLAAWTPDT